MPWIETKSHVWIRTQDIRQIMMEPTDPSFPNSPRSVAIKTENGNRLVLTRMPAIFCWKVEEKNSTGAIRFKDLSRAYTDAEQDEFVGIIMQYLFERTNDDPCVCIRNADLVQACCCDLDDFIMCQEGNKLEVEEPSTKIYLEKPVRMNKFWKKPHDWTYSLQGINGMPSENREAEYKQAKERMTGNTPIKTHDPLNLECDSNSVIRQCREIHDAYYKKLISDIDASIKQNEDEGDRDFKDPDLEMDDEDSCFYEDED